MNVDWELLYAIALVVHGLGHLLVAIHISELYTLPNCTTKSWLLSDRLGLKKSSVQIFVVLWFIVTIGFIIGGWGFWADLNWWRPLAGVLILFSVLLFILWWNAFPPNIPIQANIGNLVVIAGLIWL